MFTVYTSRYISSGGSIVGARAVLVCVCVVTKTNVTTASVFGYDARPYPTDYFGGLLFSAFSVHAARPTGSRTFPPSTTSTTTAVAAAAAAASLSAKTDEFFAPVVLNVIAYSNTTRVHAYLTSPPKKK